MPKPHVLFFRIGKLDTNIEETDYKSLIIDLFYTYANLDIDPEQIKLVVNHEYGGYKSFSFVTMNEDVNVDAVISNLDGKVTPEGFEIVVSVAEDKPRPARFSNQDKPRSNRFGDNNRGGYSKKSY